MRLSTLVLTGLFALALVAGLLVTLDASATQPAGDPLDAAVAWLATQQGEDGGFGGPGLTADVVLGLAAANLEPRLMQASGGATPLDYLMQQALSYTVAGPGAVGKLALAAVAADLDPQGFAGLNLTAMLWESYSETNGIFAADPFTATTTADQGYSLLALAAAGEPLPAAAVAALLAWQGEDGGWEFAPGAGWGVDPDSTALALLALMAGPRPGGGDGDAIGAAVDAALAYLRGAQLPSGGWGWEAASPDSTAIVIQALAAAGFRPAATTWAAAAGDPQSDLRGLQLPDGAFPDWQGAPNVMATAHALPGLVEAPFPILGRRGTAERALGWLAEGQAADGGFGSASDTADAVLAFAAAGYDPAALLSSNGLSPLDYLATQVLSYSHDGGEVGKLVLAAVAAKVDPRDFGGHDLVLVLTDYLSPTGQFNTDIIFRQSLAILALNAVGEPVPAEAVDWLTVQQLDDGSWEWAANSGWGGDPDTTAMAIQALIAAGVPADEPVVANAIGYLRQWQNPDAAFASSFDPLSNANSTAYALQALVAAGEDILADWSVAGRTPLDALQSFFKADGPAVYQWGGYFGPTDNLVATLQGIPALLGRPLPIQSPPASPHGYAAVVVDWNEQGLEAVCVPLPAAQVTGVELLQASGVLFEASPDGLVCQIGELGCPAENCFCGGTRFWSYWFQERGVWQSYPAGAGDAQIAAGSVDGWRWAEWTPEMSGPSISPSLEQLCVTAAFRPAWRGLDPDQLVVPMADPAAALRFEGANPVLALLSFGNDQNEDAVAELGYRPVGAAEWLTTTLGREAGVFTATLPLESVDGYEWQVAFSDPDGVRAGWAFEAAGAAGLTISTEPAGEPVVEPTLSPTEEPTETPKPEPTRAPSQAPAVEPTPAEAQAEPAGVNWAVWLVVALCVAMAAVIVLAVLRRS